MTCPDCAGPLTPGQCWTLRIAKPLTPAPWGKGIWICVLQCKACGYAEPDNNAERAKWERFAKEEL